jgi:uncharacterized protein (DUF885 family)
MTTIARRRSSLTVLLAVLGLGTAAAAAPAPAPAPAAAAAATKSQLDALYDGIWQRWLREDPTMATAVGDHRYDDLWPDVSPAAIARAHAADVEALAALARVDAAALAPADRVNLAIVKLQLERLTAAAPFKPEVYAVSHQGTLQGLPSPQTANELAELVAFTQVRDYENWIARLHHFDTYARQVTGLLETGMRERRTPPRVIMERVLPQFAQQRVSNPEDSPFYAPFKHMPSDWTAADRERLAAAGRAAVAVDVLPALARLERFFKERYLPACRTSVGIYDTPDGAAFYRNRIAYHTTTDLTAEQIHALGLAEVARIRGEMEAVIKQVGYTGSFAEFLHYLRTDPRFFYTDPEELLHGYMVIAKGIDPELVKLFGKLPRTPYGVRPIPETSAPNTTTAYYQPLATDGSRPGYFYVNLYRPEARPKWEMAVLTSHESVPGHHLQLALQYEQAGEEPMIRRMADFTAYVEGWGLYAESLGEELGLYRDPYQKFGELTYDMWRAVRLVVDTGIHAQGWSRQQAIDYFAANAPKSQLDIENEIDRYISWPGQALAYKIGQLKLFELRDLARRTLGADFDIREFHDVVLASGAVPLPMLQSNVEQWLAAKTHR